MFTISVVSLRGQLPFTSRPSKSNAPGEVSPAPLYFPCFSGTWNRPGASLQLSPAVGPCAQRLCGAVVGSTDCGAGRQV